MCIPSGNPDNITVFIALSTLLHVPVYRKPDNITKYVKMEERERHLTGYLKRNQVMKATVLVETSTRDLWTPAMSTASSQVGVALFPSF